MSDQNEQAFALIDDFARNLLLLNGGRTIPRAWKNRLAKAMMPPPKARGRKFDADKTARVVKLLVLNEAAIRAPRTKFHNPAVIKRHIAGEVGVSVRQVELIDQQRQESSLSASMTAERWQAHLQGISAAICSRLATRDEARRLERIARAKSHNAAK